MITFLAIVHIIACLGLIGLVLVQDSKGGGMFTTQSSSNSLLGAGGATTLAQTMTKVLAGVFAITCIVLSIMAARGQRSVIDTGAAPVATPLNPPTATAPAAGSPTTETAKEAGKASTDSQPSATQVAPAAQTAPTTTAPAQPKK